jgi:hypothetical protein
MAATKCITSWVRAGSQLSGWPETKCKSPAHHIGRSLLTTS